MKQIIKLQIEIKDEQWRITKQNAKGVNIRIGLGYFDTNDGQTVITYNAIGTENEKLIYLLVEAGVNGNL